MKTGGKINIKPEKNKSRVMYYKYNNNKYTIIQIEKSLPSPFPTAEENRDKSPNQTAQSHVFAYHTLPQHRADSAKTKAFMVQVAELDFAQTNMQGHLIASMGL